MTKLISRIIIILFLILIFAGCKGTSESEYKKYSDSFFDTFDTVVKVVAYTKSKEEFYSYFNRIHERFQVLHKLYDIYNDYEGMNNIKTINDHAGIKPIKVEKEIIDLITFSQEWHDRTKGATNIAMRPVLRIWHQYREDGKNDPENAKLPPMEKLRNAAEYTDIRKVLVDTEKSTVFLTNKGMSLDVGAVAKGYATELVVKELQKEGLISGIISAGGNVRVIGKPLDGMRERWGIGIQDPDKSIVPDGSNILDTVFINNASVVSSGDYERYYVVDDKVYHHIIDPKTLMPSQYYRAVTIVTEHSGLADLLSTAVFVLPYKESRGLVESLDGVEALWVMPNGNIEATEGMKRIMKSEGATGAKPE
ncbi:MAG: FAD:protein FMN transferase [Clostridia bacterium]